MTISYHEVVYGLDEKCWENTTPSDVKVTLNNGEEFKFSGVDVPSQFYEGHWGTETNHSLLYTILEEVECYSDCRNHTITDWEVIPTN